MVTMVGRESDTKALLKNLIQLEHDAIAAYDAMIEKLSADKLVTRAKRYRSDHKKHLEELEKLAKANSAFNPGEGSMKSLLTTGKVNLAAMAGNDSQILRAMSTNETDTITAYRRACENEAAPEGAKEFLEKALRDEERHKAWMDEAAESAASY